MPDLSVSRAEEQRRILNLIRQHVVDHDSAPTKQWLAETSKHSRNNIWNLIKRLQNKGYVIEIEGHVTLTEQGLRYFSDIALRDSVGQRFSVMSAQIRIVGEVRAGKTSPDLVEFDEQQMVTLQIPDVRSERRTYAYRVVGNSMEHERIFNGDFVIVEEFDTARGEWPRSNELIVTRYLPYYAELNEPEYQISENDYDGPTLKIYSEQQVGQKRVFRLGWKRENEMNPNVILASRLNPIGRVVSVYRAFR